MDKAHPLSCSSLQPNLPVSLTMFRSLPLHGLVSMLLLLLLSGSGESRPHVAHQGAPDADGANSQRLLLLEAVKTGILSSLGMDREPRPTQKASEEELREMYQLYGDKLTEMRGNSSQMRMKESKSTMSAVLFPATVEVMKARRREQQSDQRLQWYRAVFHKNAHIQTELTLAWAELKVSRQILEKPTSAEPEVRREIRVKVNSVHSAAWTNGTDAHHAVLDISPEVEKWMRTDGAQPLVVDVGIVANGKDVLQAIPTISVEFGLTEPKPEQRTRLSRSIKVDDCDERGWCCQKSVTVSFKDIGWSDWVVAPTEYTMHYCDGACPQNYKPASMHTQVKSRLHEISKGGTPRPCCVPSAYEPMVLMHYDSRGRLTLTPFDDLIVSKCQCA